jgi:succinyl-CoA synthetase beta subunit
MLGNRLMTKQTKKEGEKVSKVMVTQGFGPPRETYFAILMDREQSGPAVVASPAGGVDIEEVAATNPEKIFTVPVDINVGLTTNQARDLALKLGFHKQTDEVAEQMKRLYKMFIDVDAVQVEINPLGETEDGQVFCYDAKVNFDDNAKFRQQSIFEMEDNSEVDPREVFAASHHLNYIGMEGNIGCLGERQWYLVLLHVGNVQPFLYLVNGAGLAMATMDVIQANGGMPANFLDVGGGVNERQVIQAFSILNSDEQVKSIFVNIFGGIVNCATIANGVTKACHEVKLDVPLVVRLQGNNVDAAKKIMKDSGLNIMSEDDMDEAAKKAVQSAGL